MTLLFLCLARDCVKTLPLLWPLMERLEAASIRCAAIIGENGSIDQTREAIRKATHPRVWWLDTTSMAGHPRLSRMARGRQMLLDRARDAGPAAEFICVLDADEVLLQLPSAEAMQASMERLKTDPGIFAIGATSKPFFYDLLALRREGERLASLHDEMKFAQRRWWTYYDFLRRRIHPLQRAMTQPCEMECISSFNGLCLYRAADFFQGSYRGPDEHRVCEHIVLNSAIHEKTGKHMIISPELTVQAPAEHAPMPLLPFLLSRRWKLWKKLTAGGDEHTVSADA